MATETKTCFKINIFIQKMKKNVTSVKENIHNKLRFYTLKS